MFAAAVPGATPTPPTLLPSCLPCLAQGYSNPKMEVLRRGIGPEDIDKVPGRSRASSAVSADCVWAVCGTGAGCVCAGVPAAGRQRCGACATGAFSRGAVCAAAG